jgi:plasmid stabilization system protein ParE
MKHFLSPAAAAELDEIWWFVAFESGNPETADRLVDLITERFFLLALHPQMGRRLNHRTHPELRTFPVAGFVILYRVTGEFVRIVHVIRGRRDIDGLLAN